MQIVCWASLLGVACTGSNKPAEHVQASVVTAHTERGRTALDVRREGASHVLTVDRDTTVARGAAPMGATVLGEIAGKVVVMADNYPSIAGGMSYCGAGVERFLRVVSITATPPVETYRVKLASCRENIELAADSMSWQADSAVLRVHWLAGPGATHGVQVTTLRIAPDGTTRAIVQ
ncbi:MAG: hypothetical protein M3Y64_02425 [Gemmatimonadota bacterium]|nr:hypothetical protein [Gemmatimonadota bacterium]